MNNLNEIRRLHAEQNQVLADLLLTQAHMSLPARQGEHEAERLARTQVAQLQRNIDGLAQLEQARA